jgi:hypothetical protein
MLGIPSGLSSSELFLGIQTFLIFPHSYFLGWRIAFLNSEIALYFRSDPVHKTLSTPGVLEPLFVDTFRTESALPSKDKISSYCNLYTSFKSFLLYAITISF